ncbi:MAG TPA: FkbM family methyltransferase [Candidatus Micrarchaeaceae archaeon]|nr:FkbM family methyltransferase [Candidatus Micrarchaeaceae archaeon]
MKDAYPTWPETPQCAPKDPTSKFISYAQNLEDVMLWRALHHVSPGFYIDVGAGEPDVESVTRAFYDRGWTGVNIEPDLETYRRLTASRPRDTNINAALLDRAGQVTFYPVGGGNGLSTIIPEIAVERQVHGWTIDQGIHVVGDTLANICRRHAAQRPIHFLKIDVEGAERKVLLGGDFSSFRPWVVIVETQGPKAGTTPDEGFEDVFLAAGYRFVYFDGLNNYYVAGEHEDRLGGAFATPPNVYDQFIRASEVEALQRADLLQQQLTSAQVEVRNAAADRDKYTQQIQVLEADARRAAAEHEIYVKQLAAVEADVRRAAAERETFVQQLFESARHESWLAQERARLREELHRAEARYEEIARSRSWKLTAPLRALGRFTRRLR